jgi:MFS family permease
VSDTPHVRSPYEGQKLKHRQHLAISAYWFATNFLWGALLVIMLPNEMRQLAPYYRVSALGLITAISAVVALVVPLIVGALSDRCISKYGRRRPFIVAGVIVNVIGLLAMAWAFSTAPQIGSPAHGAKPGQWETVGVLLGNAGFVRFLLAYIIVQLGNNIASAAYSGIIPDLVPEQQRGAASGYMALMSQAGTLFGGAIVGTLLSPQPEWVKYAVISAVLALIASITIFGIEESPLEQHPGELRWGAYLKSLWIDPKKYPDFAWVWITRALVMLGFYSVLPFINYYLLDVIGIVDPDKYAPILMGVILIASSFSGVYGGYVSDRIGRKKVVYIANATIAVMVLAFIFCRSFNQVLIAGTLFGIGFGAYTSVDWALGTDVLPTKTNAAKEMAIWHVAMTLPQSLAAPIATIIIESFGKTVTSKGGEDIVHYTTNGYAAVFVLTAVCFSLGAFYLKNVRGVS